jgi:hypothetical protein
MTVGRNKFSYDICFAECGLPNSISSARSALAEGEPVPKARSRVPSAPEARKQGQEVMKLLHQLNEFQSNVPAGP